MGFHNGFTAKSYKQKKLLGDIILPHNFQKRKRQYERYRQRLKSFFLSQFLLSQWSTFNDTDVARYRQIPIDLIGDAVEKIDLPMFHLNFCSP